MSNTKHTPTPWIVYEGDWVTTPDNETPIASAHVNAEANAAFIVRACNSHEQLLQALRDLEVSANSLQYCFDRRPENFGVALTQLKADAERARAALAAAEAA